MPSKPARLMPAVPSPAPGDVDGTSRVESRGLIVSPRGDEAPANFAARIGAAIDEGINVIVIKLLAHGELLVPSTTGWELGEQSRWSRSLRFIPRTPGLRRDRSADELIGSALDTAAKQGVQVLLGLDVLTSAAKGASLARLQPGWFVPEAWTERGANAGKKRRWMCPFHPEARHFLGELAAEWMGRYPFAGLYLSGLDMPATEDEHPNVKGFFPSPTLYNRWYKAWTQRQIAGDRTSVSMRVSDLQASTSTSDALDAKSWNRVVAEEIGDVIRRMVARATAVCGPFPWTAETSLPGVWLPPASRKGSKKSMPAASGANMANDMSMSMPGFNAGPSGEFSMAWASHSTSRPQALLDDHASIIPASETAVAPAIEHKAPRASAPPDGSMDPLWLLDLEAATMAVSPRLGPHEAALLPDTPRRDAPLWPTLKWDAANDIPAALQSLRSELTIGWLIDAPEPMTQDAWKSLRPALWPTAVHGGADPLSAIAILTQDIQEMVGPQHDVAQMLGEFQRQLSSAETDSARLTMRRSIIHNLVGLLSPDRRSRLEIATTVLPDVLRRIVLLAAHHRMVAMREHHEKTVALAREA